MLSLVSHMTILSIIIFVMNVWNQSSWASVTNSGPHGDLSSKFVLTDQRLACLPIRTKYKHCKTICEHTFDSSPTDSSSSSLKWWSSKQEVETLCNYHVFLCVPIRRTSLRAFFACPSISNDHATVFARNFSLPGNFQLLQQKFVIRTFSFNVECIPNIRHQEMMLVLQDFMNFFHMRAIPSCRKWLQAIFVNYFKNNFASNTELQTNVTATYQFRKMWSASNYSCYRFSLW